MAFLGNATLTGNPAGAGLIASLTSIGKAIAAGFDAWRDCDRIVAEIGRLNALTDDELAAQGLKREEIARHVFRGKF